MSFDERLKSGRNTRGCAKFREHATRIFPYNLVRLRTCFDPLSRSKSRLVSMQSPRSLERVLLYLGDYDRSGGISSDRGDYIEIAGGS